MSADASSSIVSLRRRSLFVAMFALAACESDPTPIVQENANADGSMSLAPTNTPGGRGGPGVGGRDPDYRLGANDRVRIIVFGQPTLTGEYTLDGNGAMAFPLIGNVNASGMTTGQLQQTIASRLDPDYLRNPSVSAEVITRRPFYVIGEVQKPGNYPYVTDMTALQAVAMAGGYTYRARQNNLYLKRLDANGRMVRVAATPETKIRPGDTVEIKERFF
ncbi:MAG: polysaccharide export protein [Rhodospirillales bacterium]|nr:polysaccharide export protein [Rhodospirillales bacterium]